MESVLSTRAPMNKYSFNDDFHLAFLMPQIYNLRACHQTLKIYNRLQIVH